MTLWAAKGMGIMFGGVTDEDKHEETLESSFHNDLYAYQLSGKGRWVSMLLKKPKPEKERKIKSVKKVPVSQKVEREGSDHEAYEDEDVRVLLSHNSVYRVLNGRFTIPGERS